MHTAELAPGVSLEVCWPPQPRGVRTSPGSTDLGRSRRSSGGVRGWRPLLGGRGGISGAGSAARDGPARSGRGCWGSRRPAVSRPGPPPQPPALTLAGRRPPGSGSASGRRRRSARTAARRCRPRTRRTARPRGPGGEPRGDCEGERRAPPTPSARPLGAQGHPARLDCSPRDLAPPWGPTPPLQLVKGTPKPHRPRKRRDSSREPGLPNMTGHPPYCGAWGVGVSGSVTTITPAGIPPEASFPCPSSSQPSTLVLGAPLPAPASGPPSPLPVRPLLAKASLSPDPDPPSDCYHPPPAPCMSELHSAALQTLSPQQTAP